MALTIMLSISGTRRVSTPSPGRPKLKGHTDWVSLVVFLPGKVNLASGSEDNAVRVWNAQSRLAIGEPLTAHWAYTLCLFRGCLA